MATTVAPNTTQAVLPMEERPGHRGGAEGTRTPDPHTASVVRYQLRHSPLPARSGVSEPGATVQGWAVVPAQGWRHPTRGAATRPVRSELLHLRDPEVVAEGVAETEVDAVRLVHRVLGDLDATRLELGVGLERVVGS